MLILLKVDVSHEGPSALWPIRILGLLHGHPKSLGVEFPTFTKIPVAPRVPHALYPAFNYLRYILPYLFILSASVGAYLCTRV